MNNAGKSSLLRFFYEFRPLLRLLSFPSGELLAVLQGKTSVFSYPKEVLDIPEVFSNHNLRDLEIEFQMSIAGNIDLPVNTVAIQKVIVTIPRNTNTWQATLYRTGRPSEPMGHYRFDGTLLEDPNIKQLARVQMSHFFSALQGLSNTLYIGSFRNAVNIGGSDSYYDIQIGQSFIQAWRRFKTGTNKAENEAAYQVTEAISRIFGFSDLEINPSNDNETLQVFVEGRSYRLSELGSGLAQFILVLVNAVVNRPAYILIDELELNLHPSLQLDFLTTLGSFASEGVVFATHSIGLARASADWVYSLQVGEDGSSEVKPLEATSRPSEFLGELSFSGYRELGFNRVLLVEGVTDVKTIQQFLRRYHKDHKIVLLPLGGTMLIRPGVEVELDEVKRISVDVAALVDSEKNSENAPLPANVAGFKELCDAANIECKVLERRAMENYLTDRAIKK